MKNEIKITIEDIYLKHLEINMVKNNLPSYSKTVENLIHNSSDELKNIPFDRACIHNRRYMGSKTKLLEFISVSLKEVISEDISSFVDIFSGTGVVGSHFNQENIKVISNDLLYSNYLTNYAFLSSDLFDYEKIDGYLKIFNQLDIKKDNYFSKNFGGKFFSIKTSRKIGHIREEIEKLYKKKEINFREKAILITSLIYGSDKIANTCGHYDAYRENDLKEIDIHLRHLDIFHNKNINNEIHNIDSNFLFEKLNYNVDVVYADPPYNSRQYSSLYHLIENLARWEKPEVEGKASKMKNRKELNSKYCNKTAIETFEDLISNVRCKYFVLSYSNMGLKGNDRSNSRMMEEDIIRVMKSKGELIIKEMKHQPFSTGKTNLDNHKELLFICKFNS